jgi:hypothetical protein
MSRTNSRISKPRRSFEWPFRPRESDMTNVQPAPLGVQNNTSRRPRIPDSVRTLARAVARIGAAVLVVAAGIAGWFGVDRFAFAPVAGATQVQVDASPWPTDLPRVAPAWDSFTLNREIGETVVFRSSHDSATGRTRVTEFVQAPRDVEIAGLEAWQRVLGEAEWTPVERSQYLEEINFGLARAAPVHLSAIAPLSALPFISVTEYDAMPAVRRFGVSVDVAAFRTADPIEFTRWSETDGFVSDSVEPVAWILDVRPDGYVVRWEGRSPAVETWTENSPELVFESPVAALAAPTLAPVDTVTQGAPGEE